MTAPAPSNRAVCAAAGVASSLLPARLSADGLQVTFAVLLSPIGAQMIVAATQLPRIDSPVARIVAEADRA